LQTFAKQIKALSAKVVQDGLILTAAQLRPLEKAREAKQAHGEIKTNTRGIWAGRIPFTWKTSKVWSSSTNKRLSTRIAKWRW
jgi:hypothetical protein